MIAIVPYVSLAPQSLDGSAFIMACIVIGLIASAAVLAFVYVYKKLKEGV